MFFAVLAVIVAPWSGIEKISFELTSSFIKFLQDISKDYKELLDQLGVSEVTFYFVLFFTIVLIQILFVLFLALGSSIPPHYRYTKLSSVENTLVLQALQKCRASKIGTAASKRLVEEAKSVHQQVSVVWSVRNTTAMEIFLAGKGLFLASLVTSAILATENFLAAKEKILSLYMFTPLFLFALTFLSGWYLQNSLRGAQQQLTKSLRELLNRELFLAFLETNYTRRPTISEIPFAGEWQWGFRFLRARRLP